MNVIIDKILKMATKNKHETIIQTKLNRSKKALEERLLRAESIKRHALVFGDKALIVWYDIIVIWLNRGQ
jgi:hypothetical protein